MIGKESWHVKFKEIIAQGDQSIYDEQKMGLVFGFDSEKYLRHALTDYNHLPISELRVLFDNMSPPLTDVSLLATEAETPPGLPGSAVGIPPPALVLVLPLGMVTNGEGLPVREFFHGITALD